LIYAYGITQQGTYHININLVCQDAHEIIKYAKNICVAAVADGLGSEDHSDIASLVAVKIATKYCVENISEISSTEEIIDVIQNSFIRAQKKIEEEVDKNGHELNQYGTTLSLAVVINDDLYFGHAGDSGIIALTTDGLYTKVTTQQRDEEGRVFPLRFNEDRWVFGKFNKKVASVFLATDGMYETLFPFYIRDEKVSINVTLARFFMDNRILHIDEMGEEATRARIAEFIANIPDAQVNDDKTVVCIVNPSIKTEMQPSAYYEEPDWAELKLKRDQAWKREAYPQLFADSSPESFKQAIVQDLEIKTTEANNEGRKPETPELHQEDSHNLIEGALSRNDTLNKAESDKREMKPAEKLFSRVFKSKKQDN